jgi:hypothetical protein
MAHAPLTRNHDTAVTGAAVVAFLRQLLRQFPDRLTAVWDGAVIHHCRVVRDFLTAGAARRLHRERLPAYALNLNPDEGDWHLLTCGQIANRCCRDRDERAWELRCAIHHLQRRPHLLQACVHQLGSVSLTVRRSVITDTPWVVMAAEFP